MQFQVPTQVVFGVGCRNRLVEVMQEHGWSCCAVVVDPALRATERIQQLLEAIGKECTLVLIDGPGCEPTYDILESSRTALSKDIDVVIGIGGGSTLDVAKAMAVLVHNEEPALRYRGFNQMTERVLPIIALPTTAGSGSEVTPNASFVDTASQMKMGINGEPVRPKFAFLDPELTLTCPLTATLSSALDSIVHATEAYVAKKSNPIAKLLAKEGLQTVLGALPTLVEDLENLRCREAVMYGAFLSGLALMHSGTGPAAALSYPMGVRYQVPHGLGGALFLPEVVATNVARGADIYGDLLPSHLSEGLHTQQEKAERFVQFMREVWAMVGAPLRLCDVGVATLEEELVVEDTLQLAGALEQNPVLFDRPEIEQVLRKLGGEA